MSYILIDPPVTPFSPPTEIRAWLDTLRGMEQTPEVVEEIRRAEEWLRATEANA